MVKAEFLEFFDEFLSHLPRARPHNQKIDSLRLNLRSHPAGYLNRAETLDLEPLGRFEGLLGRHLEFILLPPALA